MAEIETSGSVWIPCQTHEEILQKTLSHLKVMTAPGAKVTKTALLGFTQELEEAMRRAETMVQPIPEHKPLDEMELVLYLEEEQLDGAN